ncbi:MAG: glycosyltransferase family 4 protein [Bdellovibrionales bacterium]|nr:glycosyltransferase family 4 protein [Bdellovibrionales bacterium]NQZ18097.1 glycosyltransferase family 4 protein [Bdellovibrionales bacterium]
MKVAFNARTLSAHQLRGWSRYASNLIRELSYLDLEIYLFSDRPLNEDLLKGVQKEKLKVIVKRGFLYVDFEQRLLPQLCDEHSFDILHCPINYGLPFRKNCKQVLTLHDAIEKAYYDQFKSLAEKLSLGHLYVRGLHKLSQSRSDRIITVSEHAKRDIVEHYRVSEEKIQVIYEAADPIFQKEIKETREDLQRKWGVQGDYLFYVGGFEKRKNLYFLLQTLSFMNPKPQLLIAGGGSEINSYRDKVISMDLQDKVKFLGWVEDEDLPLLYKEAKALVYPSFYEGFGLQVVEAMAMGCPVLCSDRTSLPEIWGNEEGLFDPTNGKSLAQQIEALVNDSGYEKSLRDWSKKRSQDFSWKMTALQTLDLYRSLLQSR